jgi:hypothetical protein
MHTGAVKEQRVDGSWPTEMGLRCTLMGLERDYQVRILSKQVDQVDELKEVCPCPCHRCHMVKLYISLR